VLGDKGVAELDKMLDEAFPLRPLPHSTLHQAALANENILRKISDEEWARATETDKNRTWRSYLDDELVACRSALAHLTGDAFVYYLPAFIGSAARHIKADWKDKHWALVGAVIFYLTDRSPYNLGRLDLLSPEQRKAAIYLLKLAAKSEIDESSDAEESLARYWSK